MEAFTLCDKDLVVFPCPMLNELHVPELSSCILNEFFVLNISINEVCVVFVCNPLNVFVATALVFYHT